MSEDVTKKVLLELRTVGFKELAEQQERIDQLQNRLKETTIEGGKRISKVRGAEREELKAKLKLEREVYQESVKGKRAEIGSLNELRVALARNIKQLGEMQGVGSKAWQEQAARVRQLRDQVAGAEAQYGSFQRNVGNYSGAITDAFGRMGGNVGMAARNMSQLGTFAGAAGIALAGVAGVYKLIQGAIERSADATLQMNIRTETFKQLLYDIRKDIDKDIQAATGNQGGSWFEGILAMIMGGGTPQAQAAAVSRMMTTKTVITDLLTEAEDIRKEANQSAIDDSKARLEYEKLMTQVMTDQTLTVRERFELSEKAEAVLTKMVDENVARTERELVSRQEHYKRMGVDNAASQAELAQIEARLYSLQTEQERRIRRAREAQKRFLEEEARAAERIAKLLGSELAKIKESDVKLEDDITIPDSPIQKQLDARVVAERTAAQQAADAWKQSYAAQMEALEQARAAFLVTDEQYLARKKQLQEAETNNYIAQLKQAFGANVKMQQAVAIFEQAIAVKRALANVKIAIAEGTANTAKIGFPQNIIPLALFAGQVAGLLAQIKSYGKSNVVATKGFSEGGYTGAGGKYEPAGIVHKGEVVWSQRDVAMMGGAALVDSLRPTRQLRGYAEGGIVGADPRTQFGNMRDMIREMVASVAEIPVTVSAQDMTLKQNEVRKIKVRGDL
jgi:hypothetical protein